MPLNIVQATLAFPSKHNCMYSVFLGLTAAYDATDYGIFIYRDQAVYLCLSVIHYKRRYSLSFIF